MSRKLNIVIIFVLVLALVQESAYAFHRSAHAFMSEMLTNTASGYRNRDSGGLNNVGGNGNYWCAVPNSAANGRYLNFNSGNVNPLNNNNRANGFSVRAVRAFKSQSFILNTNALELTFDQIHELTTKAYLIERKNIRNHYHPLQFEIELEKRIYDIARSLYRREYQTKPYGCFMIEDPTIREVFFPHVDDATVSHILFDMINPIFEKTFIYDSYSCRVGKGTLFGIERMEHHIRSCTDNYRYEAGVLNIDISGYFMSINKGILYSIICDTLESYKFRPISRGSTTVWNDVIDFGFVDYLVRLDLFTNPLENCRMIGDQSARKIMPMSKSLMFSPIGTGVPIGKVTNQLNSNIYLNILDQFVKRILRGEYWGRYVDDGRLISRDLIFLDESKYAIGELLQDKLKLKMHPEKTKITSTDEVFFLGAVLRPYRRYASNQTMSRFHKCVEACEELLKAGETDPHIMMSSLNSYLGYLKHFNERKAIKLTLENSPLCQIFDFGAKYERATIIKSV